MRLTSEQQAEIDALRSERSDTLRAAAPALEEVLYQPFPVLDHGFVRVVDYMGNDAAIVQAARVSYGRGTKRTRDDAGLINYLMRNAHTSPFEMCEIKLHVKLPIFVARQWIRHRTANVNEYSARYSVLDNEFYLPEAVHLVEQSTENRQGRQELDEEEQGWLFDDAPHDETVRPFIEARQIQQALNESALNSFSLYYELLNENREGQETSPRLPSITRELARIGLPLSAYTQWYWKTDLHNLLHFIALRIDPHAQWEIREYARVILDLVERWTPLVAAAFRNYRLGGARLSAEGLDVVRRLLGGEEVDASALSMSPREYRELRATLGLPPVP